MTMKKLFFIIILVIVLSAAWRTYNKHYGPQSAAAKQQQEAEKLAQLEADLIRAAEKGRGDYKKTTSNGISPRTIDSTPTTGST